VIAILIPLTIYSPKQSLILSGLLGLTWIIDFLLRNTLWFTTSILTYIVQLLYLAVIFFIMIVFYGVLYSEFIFATIVLLLALNSDAISNSRRYKFLLPLILLGWCIALSLPGGSFSDEVTQMIFMYSFVPGLACLARLFFPRTKDLLHTSLDYPPMRFEILSYGMKSTAAVGIKRA